MNHRTGVFAVLLLAMFFIANTEAAESDSPVFSSDQLDFFEKQIRPLLSKNCLSCHGSKKQESGLRLDSRSALFKGSDSGPVVEAGSLEKSLLLEAVEYDGDVQMPPEEKLSASEIADLTRWVEMGLPWPDSSDNEASAGTNWREHWAFKPILNPSMPVTNDPSWLRTSVDSFILAKLQEAKLKPSVEASRQTLIRRATFNLTGLPPKPAEVDDFLSDHGSDAYSRLIDRLLASPAYGERWGRHWLDVARYADNKGYVFFEEQKFPWAYAYRDYVIESFNADLPYDRFVLEQLAADQLELGDDPSPLRAMGFLTVGAHFVNNVHDIMDDRIDVISRGLMGLTVACARCHDHKFDPIPQADYYSLYGVMRSSTEPILLPLFQKMESTEESKKFDIELTKRVQALNGFVEAKYKEVVTGARSRLLEYLLAAHALLDQPSIDQFMLLTDKGDLNPALIRRWRAFLDKGRRHHDPVWTPFNELAELSKAQFTQESRVLLLKLQRQANADQSVNPLVLESLLSAPLLSMQQVAQRYVALLDQVDAYTAARVLNKPDKGLAQLHEAYYGLGAPLNVPKTFGWGFLDLLPDRISQNEFKKLLKELETWTMTGPGAPPRAMVLVDDSQPYQPQIFLRGNPNRLGREVPRQFLGAFSKQQKPFQRGSGRLEMAQAIVGPENPLTARVIVNRIWMHHFGQALVDSPSDFGTRSNPPSHPRLLDHLASELISSGWSIKNLHRKIMLSATYRQKSADRAECQSVDVGNRLLWKMNRRRLEFEAIRDSLLAVADSIEPHIGGPPVNVLSGFVPRRTIYGFVDRMNVPGLLTTFDFPNPVATSPGRESTTIPPQALYMMNGILAPSMATRIANRQEFKSIKDVDQRTGQLYKLLFGRSPTADEQQLARQFVSESLEIDIWQQFIHALLMTNEFVFVD